METELGVLAMAAATIACVHTLAGPDHYLPFIALSRARRWSFRKTLMWTAICGCGHVWSSVMLGTIGAAIGWSLSRVKWLEALRGGIAGWALLGFGMLYCIWGLFKANGNAAHKHFDIYQDGSVYVYEHKHRETINQKDRHAVTPWVMFVIFVLGPCEPMIPLLYIPAVKNSWYGMLLLIIIYTFFTLVIMIGMVVSGYYGSSIIKIQKLEPYTHALGGFTIFICGAGMLFMGW